MMNSAIHDSVIGAIGVTPLVALDRLSEGLPGRVVAKLEFYGPGASVKDRVARAIIVDAEERGLLKPGGTVVELTSGNMGTGLAVVCAVRGYRMIAVMSAGNSIERRRMLLALGAEVALVPQAPGSIPGKVSGPDLELVEMRTRELVAELGAYRPDQFNNPAAVRAHEETTGIEIWEQTGGRVGAFVASVGAAGTFLGTARALKARNPLIACYPVEPATARFIAAGPVGVTNAGHKIQGTGYVMVPPLWQPELVDGFLSVSDGDAVATARRLATREGIFAGFSAGANVYAALEVAANCPPGTLVATIACDTGLKYLSTDLWLE
jgi:cysteine synthase A